MQSIRVVTVLTATVTIADGILELDRKYDFGTDRVSHSCDY